ncbi:U-box domain-containing protein 13 [Camellia lanceoleosa]|uniref:U-box domain-containing protein 13 n=1 Tax=Camellia lanceoleosa TaxID=1840588 RepID=A0ACC0IUD7_9ERIC|nr:U-box domain-containing protein 13 [Camellia lanceoleosa]
MESESDAVKELTEVIETLGSFVSYRRTQRKECLNLVRRLKLLVPLLEELRDQQLHTPISDEALNCLANLKKALCYAKKLLSTCSHGSKIYLVSSLSLSIYIYMLVFIEIS